MIPYFIGLGGYSGAGKSTVAEYLSRQGGVVTLPMDSFYKNEEDCPKQDGRTHWDLPESLNLDALHETLLELKAGEDVQIPIYEKLANRSVGQRWFPSRPVILIEGMMLYAERRIRDLIDLRLWMDVPKEIARARKAAREPGRFDAEYYRLLALPATQRYVDPTINFAHHLIDGTRSVPEIARQMETIIQQTFEN